MPKNWYFRTMMLEKTLKSPLDIKEIKLINPKRNQPWIFIRRIDAEAPILQPPDAKSHFIWKDPDARKDWGQEEKGTIEDEMVGWHHWINAHEFEQTPGYSKGQESLVCYSSWGFKDSDTTEWMNNNSTHTTNNSKMNYWIFSLPPQVKKKALLQTPFFMLKLHVIPIIHQDFTCFSFIFSISEVNHQTNIG